MLHRRQPPQHCPHRRQHRPCCVDFLSSSPDPRQQIVEELGRASPPQRTSAVVGAVLQVYQHLQQTSERTPRPAAVPRRSFAAFFTYDSTARRRARGLGGARQRVGVTLSHCLAVAHAATVGSSRWCAFTSLSTNCRPWTYEPSFPAQLLCQPDKLTIKVVVFRLVDRRRSPALP